MARGDELLFQLLSESIAAYPMTNEAPQKLFPEMKFAKASMIERLTPENPAWNPYRLMIRPDETTGLYWQVEVVLGPQGDVQRVEMFYLPPPPA